MLRSVTKLISVALLFTLVSVIGSRADEQRPHGAPHEHWAYRKPVRPLLPTIGNTAWPRNGIDHFILARLEQEGLVPSPEADRVTLIRRASLDLTGLPPTPAEVDAFLVDPNPSAYEKVIDRLLASPRYGERWTRLWLDLARYADTNGYEKDRPRTMWLWRDWVIRAFNENMPFDQFTIEQLAGDLLPNPTTSQKVATGFHRNTMLNDEGGIDPEEFRVVAVKDRVDTTATVWLGTTLECAQCHDHKYDPFKQEDYYRFLAFFNHTADIGVGNGPELAVPNPQEQAQIDCIQVEIKRLNQSLKSREAELAKVQAEWEQTIRANPRPEERPKDGLYLHYPLTGGTGNDVADASGHDRAAKYAGGDSPRWVGGALQLDGSGNSGGYLDAGTVADFDQTDRFSYGCWAKPETQDGCLLSRIDDPNAYRGFDLFFYQARFEAHFVHHWPENAMKVKSKRTFEPGQWHHAFVTYDGSGVAAGIKLFVDGKREPVLIENDKLKDTIRTTVSLKVGRRQSMGAFKGLLSDVRIYDRQLSAEEVKALASRHPALDIVDLMPEKRTERQAADLAAYYRALDPELQKIQSEIAAQQTQLANVKPITTMVLQELPKPRENYLMRRGNFKNKGPTLEPGVPAVLHPLEPAQGANVPRSPNRLDLARWLVDSENPLAARVTVNRFWDAFFGHGLVTTLEDFGTQGEKPTHPELLDSLACELVTSRWSIKDLHRLIVTSATYRQASRVPEALLQRDPNNQLHARGPRLRLEYEMIRDQALAAAGLLSSKIGGPSVMPPQPPGIWENSFGFYDLPDFRWKDASGEDRYRRGIYTFLRRTALYPTYKLFDAPDRDVCSVRRSRTNTPLQALVTLNDSVFVEAAGSLARRTLIEGGTTPAERVTFAFRACLGRSPDGIESAKLLNLYQKALSRFQADPKAGEALLKQARVEVKDFPLAELAGWTVLANVLLNLDEMLTKG